MSEENVETVRRFCERDDQTSLDSLMASLHPDIEWVPVQSDPEYSVHRGHDDVRAWLTSWAESFPDLRWELDRILDAGSDLVVAFVRLAGRSDATGIDLETPSYAVVFTLRGEKIARIHEYVDSQEALEAAGLSEVEGSHVVARSLKPEAASGAVQLGFAEILDLRTEIERRRHGAPPGARPVSLTKHIVSPNGPGAIYLCQHAIRSKATLRRGAAEVAGGFAAWKDAGLPVEEVD